MKHDWVATDDSWNKAVIYECSRCGRNSIKSLLGIIWPWPKCTERKEPS